MAQVVMLQPPPNQVTSLHRVSVTVAGKAGVEATLYIDDLVAAKDTIRIDGLLDFLNVEVPSGPVQIKVTALGAGERTYSAERSIHVIGPPEQVIPLDDDFILPADGFASDEYRMEVQDEWGYRISYIKKVTLNISHGALLNEDIDPQTPGVQVVLDDGFFTAEIQAPEEVAADAYLDVTVEGLNRQIPLHYDLPMIPFILVGGLDVAAATMPAEQQDTDLPEFGILNNNNIDLGDNAVAGGRAAFYTTGSLKPGMQLTASLDTDRGYMDQLFVDVDPYEQYPLFGDASTVVYDAQTRSKLYVKLQQNENFALIGDYNTNLTDNEFTAYNRTFNGLLSKWRYKNLQAMGFATSSDRVMRQEEIRGEGISGFYFLQSGNVTRFSEKIRIITRDRYHSETVLETKDLTRFIDYDINYLDGTLMFKQAVPGIDDLGNPVFIVISYEYQSGGVSALIGGLRLSSAFSNGLTIGGTLITEERAPTNYFLYGLDARIPIQDWVNFQAEFASSSNPVIADEVDQGFAYRTEIAATPTPEMGLKAYLRQVDDKFYNPSQVGSALENGSVKYGVSGNYKHLKYGRFTSEFYRQDRTEGTDDEIHSQVFNLNADRMLNERSSLKVGYENAWRERIMVSADSSHRDLSHLLKVQYNILLLDKISGVFEHQQNLDAGNRAKPTNTSVGLTYPVTEKLNVYWKYRLIQGREVKRQSVLGFDSRIREGTQLEGKYEIGGITGDQRNRATIALNNKWELRDWLIVNLAVENAATIDSFEIPTPTHQSAALSVEFLPDLPLKAIGKYEIRDDQTSLQRVITFGGDMKVLDGFGVLTKIDHYENRYKAENAGSVTRDNAQIGLAYRPEQHDVINVLGKLAYVSDRNSHITPRQRQDRLIASSHAYWQMQSRIGLGGRIAARMVLDEEGSLFSDRTRTYFMSIRGEYALNLEWSTILDLRFMYLSPLKESVFGLAAEIDYLIMKNTQVGLGYIFKNFSDPDFAFLEYQYNNLYVSLHMKFSEDIFNWR